MSPAGMSPYKGLIPYSEEDAAFFFGRDAEREIITANLMVSRLTLLYGASGVGKSSVLRAGVAYHLLQQARQNLAETGSPEFVVVVFNSWRDDPLISLANRVRDSVARVYNGPTIEPVLPSRSLVDVLHAWAERIEGDLLIVLDQFEEYFLYHGQEGGEGTFAAEFPRAVNRGDLRANFLVSIREDALAKLDHFKGRIPDLFDKYLRVEHLSLTAARAAIEEPIAQFNRTRAPAEPWIGIEPTLTDAVLEQVRTGQVTLGEAGRGVVKGGAGAARTQYGGTKRTLSMGRGMIQGGAGAAAPEARVETPYLQLVMSRLWKEELGAGSHALRRETLDRLGGAETIIKTHLDSVLQEFSGEEREVCADIFRFLVTPSGTKIAHTVSDLAAYAGLAPRQLGPVLEKLSEAAVRILRPAPPPPDRPHESRYEIFHDVLARAILDWRARYVRERERAEAEAEAEAQRRRAEAEANAARRVRWFARGLAVLFVLAVAAGAYARYSWQQAERETAAAEQAKSAAEQARVAADRAKEEAQRARDEVEVGKEQAESAARSVQSVVTAFVGMLKETPTWPAVKRELLARARQDPESAPLVEQALARAESLPPRAAEVQSEPAGPAGTRGIDAPPAVEPPPYPTTMAPAPVNGAVVYLQIQHEGQRAGAGKVAALLTGQGFKVPGIEQLGIGPKDATEVRYFRAGDQRQAETLAALLRRAAVEDVSTKQSVGYGKVAKVGPRLYEVWFAPNAFRR